ncbi:hypothetical protein [Helicobacter sp. 13S00477-4]|uniref:hypothetical protein n=1 Tax=Helicobacter sp. 13S00477-4 TaxID=1905759 RepID=UPI000BA5F40C|nr:hypothetical protein [Helicobacter sp. 13S00477-4]PAF52856.1 hypothetical protein BKH44_01355 [Helicobacter sp. 13S00477-4]
MKIEMRKITQIPKSFLIESAGIRFAGEISRKTTKLFELKGFLTGDLELICDVSGENFLKSFNEPLVLYISDGFWDMQSQNHHLNDFDVIEFFDGFVDMNFILQSEIESIKTDYHTK